MGKVNDLEKYRTSFWITRKTREDMTQLRIQMSGVELKEVTQDEMLQKIITSYKEVNNLKF